MGLFTARIVLSCIVLLRHIDGPLHRPHRPV